ncbi:nuclear transport factor 2 family protein [Burkholderia cenocepacia]|uniref:nuclear transport factor 2 family protein n=1 Tax=Burkholderia cenocepacia TaxID=95486 RepID=UPI0023B8C9E8|nr:nuclear transport factor 2 family protein [Burkholderia cenocepacia]MDF0506451.1 nuclear transport factor 2 family protein [Burkholderia cenocepacia]
MKIDTLRHPVVRRAIDALQQGDGAAWAALFAPDATLYDDGRPRDLRAFNRDAIGSERFTTIDRVENDGLDLYGQFHSDRWGTFRTYFKFQIDGEGRISRLDIGQA